MRRNPPVSANAVEAAKARQELRAENSFVTISIFCLSLHFVDTDFGDDAKSTYSGKHSPISNFGRVAASR
jgi:hypothetical protein